MRADTYVAFLLGIGLEMAFLWKAGADRSTRVRIPGPGYSLSRRQLAIGVMALVAALLAALLRVTGLSVLQVRIDGPVGGLTFGAVFLAVAVAGVLTDHLLPRINEQVVLAVHAVVLGGEVAAQSGQWLMSGAPQQGIAWVLLALLTLALLSAVMSPGGLTLKGDALIYLWFLMVSFFLLLQNRETVALIAAGDLSPADAVAFGGVLVFLALHALFLIRFLMILSSLILPRNRPLLHLLMPRLLSEGRLPVWQLAVLVGVSVAAVHIGRLAGVALPQTPINLAAMLLVQVDWPALASRVRSRS